MQVVFFGASGAVPNRDSGNTCFLLRHDDGAGALLVDAAGDPVRHLKRAGTSVRDLDAIVLTHTHTDHIYALPSVFHVMRMLGRAKPLAVIGNEATLDFARALLDLFGHLDRDDMPQVEWQTVEQGSRYETAGFTLDFFSADHSRPCHGFAAESRGTTLVYSSDSAPNPILSKAAWPGCTLIHEASGLHADAGHLNALGHSSARQAGTVAARVAAAHLFLCGLTADTQEEIDAARREAEDASGLPVTFPEPGKVHTI